MADQFTHGYALLVGVDENQVSKWALPDVSKDLDALHGVLVHPGRCAYPAENVRVLKGAASTQAGILDGLDWLKARIQADPAATAVIYYSGHGWRDDSTAPPRFYLIPYDVREDRLRFTALRAGDFAAQVADLHPQRLLVVLDCCHAAGVGAKHVGGARVADVLPAGYVAAALAPSLLLGEEGIKSVGGAGAKGFEALAQGRGRAVLSSSSGEQSSYMRRDGAMSVFTYHLIEALTGHARPQEGATEVLVSDLMGHVTRRVPQTVQKEQGKAQTPDFQVSGNFPVALLLGGKGLGKGMAPPDPLAEIGEQLPAPAATRIDTGGGAYFGGNVDNRGTIVGRDQIVHGDLVQGDKVGGDKVTGDKIEVGPITGSMGVAIGRGARATVTQGMGGDELARLFQAIYARIDARPADPNVDKQELAETAQKIEQEAAKGQAANPAKVERWLRTLAEMADDIFDVVAACLVNPAAGVGAVIRKVVERVKRDRQG